MVPSFAKATDGQAEFLAKPSPRPGEAKTVRTTLGILHIKELCKFSAGDKSECSPRSGSETTAPCLQFPVWWTRGESNSRPGNANAV